MVAADWIAIALVVCTCALGALVGFGKGLKSLTDGIFGIIVSVFICYCLGGFIMSLPFVKDLLDKITASMTGKNAFCDWLLKIHIEVVIYYILLFIAVQLIRVPVVLLVKLILEINNPVFKIINRILGAVLFLAVAAMVVMFVFQIFYWVQGAVDGHGLYGKLQGSVFRLDGLYLKNPLSSLPDRILSFRVK